MCRKCLFCNWMRPITNSEQRKHRATGAHPCGLSGMLPMTVTRYPATL